MSKSEDDKSTIILDIKKLQAESEIDEDRFNKTGLSQILNFSALNDPTASRRRTILFDLGGDFFKSNAESFETISIAQRVDNLKELNTLIKKANDEVFFFYYNNASKQINSLLSQINDRYPRLNTVLIAKNLSYEKADQHAKTKSRAKAYLRWPAEQEQIKSLL